MASVADLKEMFGTEDPSIAIAMLATHRRAVRRAYDLMVKNIDTIAKTTKNRDEAITEFDKRFPGYIDEIVAMHGRFNQIARAVEVQTDFIKKEVELHSTMPSIEFDRLKYVIYGGSENEYSVDEKILPSGISGIGDLGLVWIPVIIAIVIVAGLVALGTVVSKDYKVTRKYEKDKSNELSIKMEEKSADNKEKDIARIDKLLKEGKITQAQYNEDLAQIMQAHANFQKEVAKEAQQKTKGGDYGPLVIGAVTILGGAYIAGQAFGIFKKGS